MQAYSAPVLRYESSVTNCNCISPPSVMACHLHFLPPSRVSSRRPEALAKAQTIPPHGIPSPALTPPRPRRRRAIASRPRPQRRRAAPHRQGVRRPGQHNRPIPLTPGVELRRLRRRHRPVRPLRRRCPRPLQQAPIRAPAPPPLRPALDAPVLPRGRRPQA